MVRSLFAPTTTYLNTATYGLAPQAVAERVITAERDRMAGRFDPYAVDAAVARSRELFGALVGVPAERVAIGAQVSPLVGMVASALRPGAVVLAAEGEFTSMLWPFLSRSDAGAGAGARAAGVEDRAGGVVVGTRTVGAEDRAAGVPAGARAAGAEDRAAGVPAGARAAGPEDRAADGVVVRTVPFDRLLAVVESLEVGEVDLVAVSVVQSADGAVVDPRRLIDAAHAAGAQVLLDVTQAAGWLPLEQCGDADWIVCGGYKWLLAPRGTAFLAGTAAALSQLRPSAPGWYAGGSPWESVYSGPVRLADDARRFDISPAWPSWLGQAVALELLASIGVGTIHAHDVRLANRLRSGLGLPAGPSAIVSLDQPPEVADRLAAAGVVASVRAGRLRLSCHLHNDDADVDRALEVLTSVHAHAA